MQDNNYIFCVYPEAGSDRDSVRDVLTFDIRLL
jgi:hypothetical protein